MFAAGFNVKTAVILAGGLGTRLRDEVPDVPKPMAPVGGQPFLQHQLDFWISRGIRRFILSVGYRREVIIERFGNHYRDIPVDYAIEDTQLGTGGGLLLAAESIAMAEPFLLLNGDTFFDVSLTRLSQFHEATKADLSVALFRADVAGRYGRADIDGEQRLEVLASATADVGELANGGVYCLRREALTAWAPERGRKLSFETEILPGMLARGMRLFGLESPGRFIDIGVPADYRRALATITGL